VSSVRDSSIYIAMACSLRMASNAIGWMGLGTGKMWAVRTGSSEVGCLPITGLPPKESKFKSGF
jgi:hypothetical protein